MHKVWLLSIALLLSGCVSGDGNESSTEAPFQETGEASEPFTYGGEPGNPEAAPATAEPEPHGEPTYDEGHVVVTDNQATKTHTWTNNVGDALTGLLQARGSEDIRVSKSDDGYKVELIQHTTYMADPEFMFDQYDIDFHDVLMDQHIEIWPLYELKPDSLFACKPLPSGGNACIGSAPVTTSINVYVPETVLFDLDLDANIGDIRVDFFGKNLDASVNTGDIRVEGDFQDVDLGTNTGSIRFTGSASNLDAGTNTGDIRVEAVAETLELDTNQGEIRVEWTPFGTPSLDSNINTGDFRLKFDAPVEARLVLDTNTGDIDVGDRFIEVDEGVWESAGYQEGDATVDSETNTGDLSVDS